MAQANFAARAASIFGGLGQPAEDAPSAWQLNTTGTFNPGAEDALERDDTSEDEEGQPAPQCLPGAAGSDDEEEATYSCKASMQYRHAFEREAEEDEYDRLAAGSSYSQDDEPRPLRSMEVLDDNALDRIHQHHRQHQQQQATEPADTASAPAAEAPAALQPAAAPAAASGPVAMDVDDDLPPLEQPSASSGAQAQAPHAPAAAGPPAAEQPRQAAKRHKPSRGGVWVPPHRRPDFRPAEPAEQAGTEPSSQQQQQQQQQRRVRFAPDAGASNSNGRRAAVQGQRGWAGRGGRPVPDHVKNPHKYTVYTLDEPIYVGQGGTDDIDGGNRQQQEGQHQRRRQQQAGSSNASTRAGRSSSSGSGSGGGRGSKQAVQVEREQEDHQQEQWRGGDDDAPMLLSAPQAAAVPTAAGDASPPREQLPLAGSIKFAPTQSKRVCAEEGAGSAAAGRSSVSKHARGAFLDDEDDAAEDVPEQQERPSSVGGKKSRQHLRRRAEAEDD